MSMQRQWGIGGGALILGLVMACGGTVRVEDGSGGAGAGTAAVGGQGGVGGSGVQVGTGAQGGGGSIPGTVAVVNAPDQFTVSVAFSGSPPAGAIDPQNYTIDSPYGGLSVVSAALVSGSNTVLLTTGKQKLGVSYTLTAQTGGDGPATFTAADTARFWTVDLSSPNFEEVELTCNRIQVGEHAVIYVAQGEFANNAKDAVEAFDSTIYPLETSMFHPSPDQDGNDRVVLLGVDGKGAFGGYFNPVDTLSDAEAQQFGYHSNETDILYLNVENGTIDSGDHVVAHEFMHMLYHEHPAHDSLFDDWNWHNEGMAECGVRAVTGDNAFAPYYFVEDPFNDIADGLSLVDWQGGNYSQYALSYIFLSYVAGQLGGVDGYPTLFDLYGSPDSVDSLLQGSLGVSFGQAHRDSFIATQLQQPSGMYSFNGLINFPGPPKLASTPLFLEPFSAAFVQPSSPTVSYPGTQGPNIRYIGINAAGNVDLNEPFDTAGGRLLIFNQSQNVNSSPSEPSGNVFPALQPGVGGSAVALKGGKAISKTEAKAIQLQMRKHPPPFNPMRLDIMRAWQRGAGLRD